MSEEGCARGREKVADQRCLKEEEGRARGEGEMEGHVRGRGRVAGHQYRKGEGRSCEGEKEGPFRGRGKLREKNEEREMKSLLRGRKRKKVKRSGEMKRHGACGR